MKTISEFTVYRRTIRNGENTDMRYDNFLNQEDAVKLADRQAYLNNLHHVYLDKPEEIGFRKSDVVYGNPFEDGLVIFVRKEEVQRSPVLGNWLKTAKTIPIPYYEAPGQVTAKDTKFSLNLQSHKNFFYEDTFAKAAIEKIFNTRVAKVFTNRPGRYETGTYRMDKNGTVIVHLDGSVVVGGKMGVYSQKGTQWTHVRGPRKEKKDFNFGLDPKSNYKLKYSHTSVEIYLKYEEVLHIANRIIKMEEGRILTLNTDELLLETTTRGLTEKYHFSRVING